MSSNHPTEPIVPIVRGIHRPSSILFVGNSFFFFNNGICRWMRRLIKGLPEPVKLRTNMAAINGASLSWHDVESYFRPDAISSYSFDSENRVVFRHEDEKLWDAVILLDSSQGPIHPELGIQFAQFAQKDAQICRNHAAEPVFVMTWGYANRPGMTRELALATLKVANDCRALVIPVGPAFESAMQKRPGLNLIIEDHRHPKPEGTYLMACVVIEDVLGIDVRNTKEDAGLDSELASYLRTIAHETVKEFFQGGLSI